MKVFDKTDDLLHWRENWTQSVGLVPTMGNLHEGHLSLIRKSLKDNMATVVSIFVNARQFDSKSDFENYPVSLNRDLSLLEKECKDHVLIVYVPCEEEIFPCGFSTSIMVHSLSERLCGKSRPGHFEGVCTVVYRLFSLVSPHHAYFGEKDYQQYLIVKKMTEDLGLDISLVPMPIVRDRDGLALSSRNNLLSSEQRQKSLILPETLKLLEDKLKKEPGNFKEFIEKILLDSHWDYLGIYDDCTLEEKDMFSGNVLLAGALFVGKVRLIDNRRIKAAGLGI